MLELLGIALFIIVIVIIGSALYLINYILVKLPEQQRRILECFSPMIVNQVELEYATLRDEQKKQIAEEKMRDIFVGRSIYMPDDTMIEAAIASAMYRVKQEQATLRMEALRDEIIRMQVGSVETIAEIPVSLLPVTPQFEEEQWIL